MNITILGSTSYQKKMNQYADELQAKGHQVQIPAFDNFPDMDEIGVCTYNLNAIKWADEIHVFWDGRSIGFIFDFGMCFALGKKMVIVYVNKKSFMGLLEKYTAKKSEEKVYTKSLCSVCLEPQFDTPSGISCVHGHGGAKGIEPGDETVYMDEG